MTGWLSGVHLHDMNCGLKAFRVEVARNLDLYGELHRFVPVLARLPGDGDRAGTHRPRQGALGPSGARPPSFEHSDTQPPVVFPG